MLIYQINLIDFVLKNKQLCKYYLLNNYYNQKKNGFISYFQIVITSLC